MIEMLVDCVWSVGRALLGSEAQKLVSVKRSGI